MSKLNKRIMSAVLAFILFMTNIPVVGSADNSTFAITYEGETVKKVEFYNHEKITVCAENIPEGSHQWQIKIPGTEQWVNIHGQTDAEIGLSYAVVGSLLVDDSAYVRCAAISEGLEIAHTATLRVTVKEEPVQQEPVYVAPVIEATEAPIEETDAPVEETEAPVEATEAPVEETEAPVEETEAPVEETEAPVEETEAPVEETEAPVEETEAPVEETEAPVEETEAPAVEETEAPAVEETEAPIEETEAPVETTETPAEPVAEVPAAPAEEEPAAPVAETEAAIEETEAPAAEPVIEETEEATEATEAPRKTSKKSSKKSSEKATQAVTNQKTESVTPKAGERAAEFVTVRIQYMRYDYVENADGNLVLSDNGQAFNPYVATLLAGSDLNTVVTFPTMVGYDTFVGEETTAQASLAINLTDIQENVDYIVKYKPAQVDYTVRYYFQNVYDDNYVEDSSIAPPVAAKGPTGFTPDDAHVKAEFAGFTSLYYEPESIAADGSTVFEVYYERNYYLMEFDCTGGYGTDTLYVRYGSYISVPQPIRTGYIFDGWDLVKSENPESPVTSGDGTVDTLPAEMPRYNSAYEAVWSTTDTKYTIVYWRENANDGGYSYWGTASADAVSADVLIPGDEAAKDENSAEAKNLTDAEHFTYNAVRTVAENPATVTVAGDGSSAINVYYSRNYYTITFKATGKCTAHVHGEDCVKPLLCGTGDHVHGSECVSTLTCDKTVHEAHSSECLICKKEEHIHGDTNCECTLQEHTHTNGDFCCTKDEHTHSIECYDPDDGYALASNQTGYRDYISKVSNPKEGYVYRYRRNTGSSAHYYFYDGQDWYYLGQNTYGSLTWRNEQYVRDRVYVSGTQSNMTCELDEHSHGDGNCSRPAECPGYEHTHGGSECNCTITVHTHNDACYSDVIHTHTDDCYTWTCGESAHTHTDACYGACIYPNHTHGGNCNYSSRTNTVKQVTRKYGADISDIWPITDGNGVTYDDGQRWKPSDSSYYTQVLVFLKNMPGDDFTLTLDDSTNSTYTMHYYVEVLDDSETTHEYNGKKFKLAFTPVSAKYGYVTKAEDFFDIAGFTQWTSNPTFTNNQISINGGGNVYFYYTRNQHNLKYYNYNDASTKPESKTLYYQQSLTDFEISKAVMEQSYYPDGLEPGAYEFGGWYTTPGCYSGTEVNWNTDVMPDTDLEIYAKWVPVTHNVYFYNLYTDIGTENYWLPKDGDGTEIHIDYPIEVQHGALLGTTYNYIPDREGYTFVGWFYMDEDNKKRFAPDSMEIKEDLHLFAEWQSGVDTEYNVTYVLAEDVTVGEKTYSTGTAVANPTSGHSTAGKTKTFTAKGMGELYEDFRQNLFPTVNSHSILMDQDKTKNNYQFTYVHDELVYYQIRYVDYVSGVEILESQIKESRNAIVTEKFMPKAGYVPMNFYIRKALVSDGNATDSDSVKPENIITFYYTQDTEHGMYSIEYYQQTADGTDYVQYESIVGSADLEVDGKPNVINVGGEFQIRPYEGYTYYGYKVITYDENGVAKKPVDITPDTDLSDDNPQGEVSYTGLTIQLYYNRNEYPYIIEYREFGTEKLLKQVSDNSYKAKFDTEVSHKAEKALTVDGSQYVYYITDPKDEDLTKVITIRAFADGKENPNKLIFYYLLKKVDVLYHAVYRNTHLTDLCYVSMAGESATSAESLLGSSAMPGEGFRFVGWYSDEVCQTAVDPSWITEVSGYKHLKPQTLNNDLDEVNYYALFEPIELTVTYDANGGVAVPSETSRIGETITLPATTKDGYTLLGWWYDADGDTVIDEGEEYAAGSEFTMPAKDVDFTAQWIDSRIDNQRGVFVGINMSFYKDGDSLYYSFDPNEPTVVNLEAARAYIKTKDADGNDIWTWMIQEGGWNNNLPGEPEDYIDPTILTAGDLVTNGDVIGVFDKTGVKTKKYLRLTSDDYKGIVQAWLNAKNYLKGHFSSANIDWNSLPSDPTKYEVIPYVVKRHHHGLTGKEDWFIDVIIVPKAKYSITYELNLKDGYVDTAPQDNNEYGQGFIANVAKFHDVARTDNPDYIAKFLGWHYDANKNGEVDDGEVYAGGSKITIPAEDVELTALWSYRMNLTIQTTSPDEGQHYIFNVSGTAEDGTNVNLTVSLGANDEKKIVDLPEGTYAVTEQSDWRWKYGMPTVTHTTTTRWKFDYNSTEVDWLGGEGYNPNKFEAVT